MFTPLYATVGGNENDNDGCHCTPLLMVMQMPMLVVSLTTTTAQTATGGCQNIARYIDDSIQVFQVLSIS